MGARDEGSGRRDFLKKGLLAVGAAATGAAGVKGLCAAQPTAALTAEGKLVRIDGETVSHCQAPPAPSDARVGIASRKWVMVVDLSKCDG